MSDIQDIADYILISASEAGETLVHHKLHRLLFYVQAWSLVEGAKAFDEKFQAWVHGPVSRSVFDRFLPTHTLYDTIGIHEVRPQYQASNVDEAMKRRIDEVLDAYLGFGFIQLSDMTRRELPWIQARGALAPDARCEDEIDETVIKKYYQELLDQSQVAHI